MMQEMNISTLKLSDGTSVEVKPSMERLSQLTSGKMLHMAS
jgi:hypothetical protein